MVGRAVLACAARLALAACLAACLRPDYECASDRDCDVGTAGRCEIDHRCTAADATCPTHRRYAASSGPLSGTCFDDTALPRNLCAAGQPPAPHEGCADLVCNALPSCCTSGWSEACVQQAQIQCDLLCDTRIAITANKPGRSELWDLRWNGRAWSAKPDPRSSVLAWLAPAPGTDEPRLAGFASGALIVDDLEFPVATSHNYIEVTSVDFDRDGRPTVALGFNDGRGVRLEITKLDDGSSREVVSAGATRLSWGDVDHDVFPDGIAGANTSTRYHLLSNIEAATYLRDLDDRVIANVTGNTTGNPPAIRSFDWADLDGDRTLDVVVFGWSVDIHLGRGDAIGPTVLARLDCDPPATANSCDAMVQAAQAFAGALLPFPTPALILASQPARALYRTTLSGSPITAAAQPYTFPAAPACGTTCPPILAVVARDLDGDHALDIIAIDADLQVFTGLARDNLQLRAAIKIPTSPATPAFLAVRTSVSGAPR